MSKILEGEPVLEPHKVMCKRCGHLPEQHRAHGKVRYCEVHIKHPSTASDAFWCPCGGFKKRWWWNR